MSIRANGMAKMVVVVKGQVNKCLSIKAPVP